MAIKDKDVKLLWGRAAGRCSFPKCAIKLSEDKTRVTASFPLGEMAHIVAEEAGGPRGESVLTVGERNSYANLLLLCPTHHTVIDKNPDDYPVEKLHQIKQEHELWVEERFSDPLDIRRTAHQRIYAHLVDSAVELAKLTAWQNWTSWVLAPAPRWPTGHSDQIFELRQVVARAAWPDSNPELQRAITTLAGVLHEASQVFGEHAEADGDWMRAVPFYKTANWNPNYDKDLRLYEQWAELVHILITEATRAANWFADVVRRDLNPMFFAVEGRFSILYGPNAPDGSYRAEVPVYTEAEQKVLPDNLPDRLRSLKASVLATESEEN